METNLRDFTGSNGDYTNILYQFIILTLRKWHACSKCLLTKYFFVREVKFSLKHIELPLVVSAYAYLFNFRATRPIERLSGRIEWWLSEEVSAIAANYLAKMGLPNYCNSCWQILVRRNYRSFIVVHCRRSENIRKYFIWSCKVFWSWLNTSFWFVTITGCPWELETLNVFF